MSKIAELDFCFRGVILFWTQSFAHDVLLQSGFETYLSTWYCRFWIQNFLCTTLLSFNVKLVFLSGVTIWIWSLVSDLLLLLKFETSIGLDVVIPIRSFLSSFLSKLKLETLFPNCYYDSIPKPRFCLVITIQIWSFASDFSFEFKLEVLLSTSNSNSVQMRSQRWNIDPNFFFELILNLCLRLSVRIQTRNFFSYFLFE